VTKPRSFRLLLALVLVALVSLAGGVARGAKLAYAEKYALPNGLTVILAPDRTLPVVAVNLWYRVGAKDEPAGRSGFAHLFEHLMFMGTERVPTGQFDTIMEGGGGSNNATTSFDRTNYFESGPSSLLPTLLWLEADRMEALGRAMTQEKLDLQREVVRNERRQSYEIQPYGKAELVIDEKMWPEGHPYRLGVIGSHEEIEAATVEDVKQFFATYYVPNNCALVVVGDFDPAAVKPMIASLFGTLPKGAEPPRRKVEPARLAAGVRETVGDAVELPRSYFVWHSPPHFAPGDAEMDLVAAVLAQGKNSRLYTRLVYDQKLAQEVEAYQASAELGSLFQVSVTARPGVSLDDLEAAVDREVRALVKDGPTALELTRARNAIETSAISALQSALSRADRLNQYEYAFGEPDGLERDLERYRKPTPQDVRGWAERVLEPDLRLVLRVVPEEPAPAKEEGPRDRRPQDGKPTTFVPAAPVLFALPNGLSVWHFDRPGLPLVSMSLRVPAGSVRDPAGRSGLASLTASMLEEGAGDLGALEFANAMDVLGATFGTSVERHGASVRLQVLRSNLEKALELYGNAVRSPRFEASEFRRLKDLKVNDLKQDMDDPQEVARRVGYAAFFGAKHPYGAHPDGTPRTVGGLGLDDVKSFHAALWNPKGSTLLVAGDVRRADLERMLEKTLGKWKAGSGMPPTSLDLASQPGPFRVLVVDRPGAAQTVVRFVLPGPAYDNPDRVALGLLETVFGGSFTSRLNTNLRETHGYTYGAGSTFLMLRRGGCLVASSSVRTNVTGASLKEFLVEFGRMQKGDVTEEEAGKARATVQNEVAEDFERLDGVLDRYAPIVVNGLRPAALAADVAKVPSVTAADLNRLATLLMRLDRGVLVLVGDRAKILPQLAGIALPEPEVVDPSTL
jgi:predicted Zn-dependent peptidase